jgi:hypothetical protein
MIQYAPLHEYGDGYVYARIRGDKTVLVVLNGADREAELDMSRYSDVTAGFRTGRDVTTGAVFPLADKLRVPARGAYVLDLQK